MVDRAAPVGSKPVKLAVSIPVCWVKIKSSAVSVSSRPGPLGRDSVAIFPSGSPVLNVNTSPTAGAAIRMAAPSAAIGLRTRCLYMSLLRFERPLLHSEGRCKDHRRYPSGSSVVSASLAQSLARQSERLLLTSIKRGPVRRRPTSDNNKNREMNQYVD